MSHPHTRFEHLRAAVTQGASPLELYGLSPAAAAWSLARLWFELRRPLVLVTPGAGPQTGFLRDLHFFLAGYQETFHPDDRPTDLYTFPAYENLSFVELTPDLQTASARLETAYALATRTGRPMIVTSGIALAQSLPPRDRLAAVTEYLVVGQELDREKFLGHLAAGGYTRRPLVEEKGDFSVRGGVIDFFPPLSDYPVRLEFWGDTIESIRQFNPASQRSAKHLEDVIVKSTWTARPRKWPATACVPSKAPKSWNTSSAGSISPELNAICRIFTKEPKPWGTICPIIAWWPSGTRSI